VRIPFKSLRYQSAATQDSVRRIQSNGHEDTGAGAAAASFRPVGTAARLSDLHRVSCSI
jgi:hypothetical protein